MTVYIFGGSNTAMTGGWADILAMRLYRKQPVRNLGLGATNSLNALTRLISDVQLCKGDVVIWANAINDAICLSGAAYDATRFIQYVETMIRRCQQAGARFVPLLFDTFPRHLVVQQADYAARIADLVAHYKLDCAHIPLAVARDTGTAFIPRQHFTDPLHMVPEGELCHFVAEETLKALGKSASTPADVERLFLGPETEFACFDRFEPGTAQEGFDTDIYEASVWRPPVSLTLPVPKGARGEIEGIMLVADPNEGRIDMQLGNQTLPLSGAHNFPVTGKAIALSVSLRILLPKGLSVADGDRLSFVANPSLEPIATDMYFRPPVAGPGNSQARVVSVLLRYEAA